MSINVQSGGTPAPAPQLLEAYDQLDGPRSDNSGGGVLLRGMVAREQDLFWSFGGTPIVVLSNNARARELTAIGTTVGMGGPFYTVPLDHSGALDLKPLRQRYRFAALVWRDVLTGGALAWLALNNQNDGRSLYDFATIWGIEVVSNPAVFGGNWFVRKRLVTGGAITTYADSGLSPLVPRRIVFDYTTAGPGIPRALRIRIDGVQVYAESGDVALGFQSGGAGSNKLFGLNCGLSDGAGSKAFLREAMYRWEFLSDPWGTL